ncbi:MAG: DUF6037 family protein [Treponema sp.]
MKISEIASWYHDIKNHNLTYDSFICTYEKVNLDILLDINTVPFQLTIISHETGEVLTLSVECGYEVQAYLSSADLNTLRSILKVPNGNKYPFSPTAFFRFLTEHFPNHIMESKVSYQVLSKLYHFEEKNRPYYWHLICWEKYPESGKHATLKNKEKTRIRYPAIYAKIKDKDISVAYRADKRFERDIENDLQD